MKKVLWILLPLTITVSSAAQDGGPSARLSWRVTARDTISTAHEATEAVTNAVTGEVTNRAHRYVEVGSGLNYRNETGQWVESKDLVELTTDGGAAAVRGPTKVYFSPNLNSEGAITLVTVSNHVLRTRPLAVVFHDAASDRVALVASLQNCVGELVSPNQVVYKSAFGSLADIRLTYTKAAIESDLVLLQQPALPAGWDPGTTRLELWHQWLDAPTPRQNARLLYRETDPALRRQMVEPDFSDNMLHFGELLFPTGAAYWSEGSEPPETNAPVKVRVPDLLREAGRVPVAKTWLTTPNGGLLIEAVRWQDIQPILRSLPASATSTLQPAAQNRLTLLSALPAPNPNHGTGTTIKMASNSYHPAACVLDYVTLTSPDLNYTFAAGTYYMTGGGLIDGCTFSPGCVFKFAPGAGGFLIYGYSPVTFNGSSSSPVILTAWNDNSVGETIYGSDGCPAPNSSYGIYVYYADHAVALNGLRIRFAQTGVQFDANYGSTFTHTFADSLLEFCEYGLFVNSYALVSVEYSRQCGVIYPESGTDYEAINNFSGRLEDICPGGGSLTSVSFDTSPPSSPLFIDTSKTVQFSAVTTGTPLQWTWDFGDGYGSFCASPVTHVYSKFGTYQATLTVRYGDGTVSTMSTAPFTVYPRIVNVSHMQYQEAEPTMAVNPNLNASGHHDIYVFSIRPLANGIWGAPIGLMKAVSTDGGQTWSSEIFATGTSPDNLPQVSGGDPCAVYDSQGNLFLSYLTGWTPPPYSLPRQVVVAELPANDPTTWRRVDRDAFISVNYGADQPWLAVGPAPPNAPAPETLWLCVSDNDNLKIAGAFVDPSSGNVGPFASAQNLPGPGGGFYVRHPRIAVGPAGQVICVYQVPYRTGGGSPLTDTVVSDHGLIGTFDTPVIADYNFNPIIPIQPETFLWDAGKLLSQQPPYFSPAPGRGVSSAPEIVWDRGSRNRVYIAYADVPSGSTLPNTDVYVQYADYHAQGMMTWIAANGGQPIESQDGGTAQFMPAIAVEQGTGNVAVGWYDGRWDTINSRKVQYHAAVSRNGGVSFGQNLALTPSQSDASLLDWANLDPAYRPDFLDYTALAYVGGVLYAAWADNANSPVANFSNGTSYLDIYMALGIPPSP